MTPLEIFPHGSLAASVITTVWVGVWVVAFFNLRLGWVLSGLVVPGYLAPLILIKPWSAGVVVVEGIVTYLLVWGYSEYLGRKGLWHSLFGRDRFFALVLTSVVVRVVFDGLLLPRLGESLERAGYLFDYANDLHSFGLIIVSLVANQFWKTGVMRGLPPFLITLGATVLIVRFGLMEWTNFTLSGISHMYEDLASSILAAPKAYIILLTTAFVASRMNLYFGWEFNGILIPSLLALQWYNPTKILTSFVEAFIILGLAVLVLRLPWFARMTVEGGRKLLLFFNIAFVYKLLLGYLIYAYRPEYKATDFFAFGYLLSTLLAIKMHDKGIALKLTSATLQTSLAAVFVASVVGFMLTLLPSYLPPQLAPAGVPVHAAASASEIAPLQRLRMEKPALYQARMEQQGAADPIEADAFGQALELLRASDDPASPRIAAEAPPLLAAAGYRLEILQGRYSFLSEIPPAKGRGVFIIDHRAAGRLLLEVPAAMRRPLLADGGIILLQELGARALMVGGGQPGRASGSRDDPLLAQFERRLGMAGVVRLSAVDERPDDGSRAGQPEGGDALLIPHRLPAALSMDRLRSLVGPFRVEWNAALRAPRSPLVAAQVVELRLARESLRRLLFRPLLGAGRELSSLTEMRGIEGYLRGRLAEGKAVIAPRGSDLYRPPDLETLLFIDEAVLTPLLRLAREEYADGGWSEEGLRELRVVAANAGIVGYRLLYYRHLVGSRDYLLLEEREDEGRGYRGSYVFRLGPASPYAVQVPRPLFEVNTFEFGVALFERLEASALLIGGAHPQANRDRSADLARAAAPASLFDLVAQVVQRERGERPMASIQSRAFGQPAGAPLPAADLFFAEADGAQSADQLSGLSRELHHRLAGWGMTPAFVDGAGETAGYQAGSIPQAAYRRALPNKRFVALWLSPVMRVGYRNHAEDRMQQAAFAALGLETEEGDLFSRLEQAGFAAPLPDAIRRDLIQYLQTRDIVRLNAAIEALGDRHWQRFIDLDSDRPFLLISAEAGPLQAVVALADGRSHEILTLDAPPLRADIEAFARSRTAVLEMRR